MFVDMFVYGGDHPTGRVIGVFSRNAAYAIAPAICWPSMISKFGLYPGGSWVFHSARQSCQVGCEEDGRQRLWAEGGCRFAEVDERFKG